MILVRRQTACYVQALFYGAAVWVSGAIEITVSERYALDGTDSTRIALDGTDNTRMALDGTETTRISLEGS